MLFVAFLDSDYRREDRMVENLYQLFHNVARKDDTGKVCLISLTVYLQDMVLRSLWVRLQYSSSV